MKFAVPMEHDGTFYTDNPCTAPQFAIYSVHINRSEVFYALITAAKNPWLSTEGVMMCDPKAKAGECPLDQQQSLSHLSEHYAMLEAINGCSYLLAQNFCENTRRAMRNSRIKIFQIPPFITTIEKVIQNFLIGAKIADNVQCICHAS